MPHRRGHGQSTGVYLDEYVQKWCSKPGQGSFCKMEYLHKQELDVKEAVNWIKARKDSDPKRLAIGGHSYGGIATMFTNTRDLGQRAVLDFAGASQSWEGDPAIVARIKDDVVSFDLRCIGDDEVEPLAIAIERALAAGGGDA